MTISQNLQDSLCVKLRSVGLKKEIVLPLINSINRSVKCEGPENVVKRLKRLKQAAVSSVAGQEVDLSWIAHNGNGPKGPIKPVWKMMVNPKSSNRHRSIAFNALMVYAHFSLKKGTAPTKTQERKFLSSVVQDPLVTDRRVKEGTITGKFCLSKVLPLVKGGLKFPSYCNYEEYPDILEYCAQIFGTRKGNVQKSERIIESFLGSDSGRHFHMFPEVQKVLGEVGENYFELTHPWNSAYEDWQLSTPAECTKVTQKGKESYDTIGVIGFTQEPGLKFRAFASPNIVVQAALEPMKRYLLDLIRDKPWDCTHDQGSGVQDVQRWLQDDKTVYSVDLSDATNNFPLSLTMEVLKSLNRIPKTTLRLFENVSKSEYRLMWESKTPSVGWTVGQPLGTGPSFPAFALSHAIVALTAERLAGIPEEECGTTFRILGDDFVTCDSNVHDKYRVLLARLECPVSEDKCLVSNTHAEFAGKLITSTQILHGYKYKDISDASFMDVIRGLGPQAVSRAFLTKEQLRYAKLVQSYPEPFGLGYNPQGIPLADRYAEYLVVREALDLEKPNLRIATSSELRNLFLYQAKGPILSNAMRWPANPKLDPRKAPSQDFTSENILSMVKDEALKPIVLERGDPRPQPDLTVRTADLAQRIKLTMYRFGRSSCNQDIDYSKDNQEIGVKQEADQDNESDLGPSP